MRAYIYTLLIQKKKNNLLYATFALQKYRNLIFCFMLINIYVCNDKT